MLKIYYNVLYNYLLYKYHIEFIEKKNIYIFISFRQLLHSDLSLKRMNSRKCGITSAIDSDVELEETISNNYNQRNKIVQRFMSFVSIIVLWFMKFLEFLKLKTVKRREYYATYEYQEYGIVGLVMYL